MSLKTDGGIIATVISWIASVWSLVGAVLYSLGWGEFVGWFPQVVELEWLVLLCIIGLLVYAN